MAAAPDDSHAAAAEPDESRVVAAELDETRVVAEVQPGGFHAAVEARDVTHVPVAAWDEPRVAVEAPRVEPAEAGYCVAFPDAIAVAVAAGSLVDALVLQVVSAEFQADEKAAAVSFAALPNGYCRVALVAALVDDCSPAVCPGTAAAADLAQPQMADGDHCEC